MLGLEAEKTDRAEESEVCFESKGKLSVGDLPKQHWGFLCPHRVRLLVEMFQTARVRLQRQPDASR